MPESRFPVLTRYSWQLFPLGNISKVQGKLALGVVIRLAGHEEQCRRERLKQLAPLVLALAGGDFSEGLSNGRRLAMSFVLKVVGGRSEELEKPDDSVELFFESGGIANLAE